jgi:hypothetical protein
MLLSGFPNARLNWTIPQSWQCFEYARTGRREGLLLSDDEILGFSFVLLEGDHRPEAVGL